jgi:hypothetical protein
VGDIDDDDVGAGGDELRGTLEIVSLRANRGAHAQPSLCISGGERQLALLNKILRGNQAKQRVVFFDERQLFDLAGTHDLSGGGEIRHAMLNDELLPWSHSLSHGSPAAINEP